MGNATGHCEYFYYLKNCLRFDHFNYGNYSKAEYIFDKNKNLLQCTKQSDIKIRII